LGFKANAGAGSNPETLDASLAGCFFDYSPKFHLGRLIAGHRNAHHWLFQRHGERPT
jgi:hypothetical protein